MNPSAAQQWWVAAAQAVTFLITDVAGIAIEMKWHKFDFLKFMPKRPFRILFFLGWLQLLGNIRLFPHRTVTRAKTDEVIFVYLWAEALR